MVDWKEYQEKEIPPAGTVVKGVLVVVESGLLKSYLDPNALQKWANCSPDDPALSVQISTESGVHTEVIALPKDKIIHGRSKLGKWKKLYGSYPEPGQQVNLVYDAKGYLQLQL